MGNARAQQDETLSSLNAQWQEAARQGDSARMREINDRIVTLKREKIDADAHQAATSPTNDRPAPTDAQKEAGNYAKGHTRISGMDVTIENPKGSERSSKSDAPKPWKVTMPAHYGYIKGTKGSDGDHVDIFIGDKGDNGRFWVINQTMPDAGTHDEHKVITGVDSAVEAIKLYKASFSGKFGDKVFGSISQEMDAEILKAKLPEMERAKPVAVAVAKAAAESEERTQTSDKQAPVDQSRSDEQGAEVRQLTTRGEPASAEDAKTLRGPEVEFRKRLSVLKSLRECLG